MSCRFQSALNHGLAGLAALTLLTRALSPSAFYSLALAACCSLCLLRSLLAALTACAAHCLSLALPVTLSACLALSCYALGSLTLSLSHLRDAFTRCSPRRQRWLLGGWLKQSPISDPVDPVPSTQHAVPGRNQSQFVCPTDRTLRSIP